MRKLLVIALVVMGGSTMAFGQSASYLWNFAGGGDTAVLANPGDTAVIEVYIEIDVPLAGWHYDLNAEYNPAGTPNFEMTDLAWMPQADRYDGLVVPDINDYRSFADILEQDPGVYWLDPGLYLIEELEITATALGADGVITFDDSNPPMTYNVLYKDPGDGIMFVPDVTTPGPLTVLPEPATLAFLALGGLALLRRR